MVQTAQRTGGHDEQPNDHDPAREIALAYLTNGDFARGLPLYELRTEWLVGKGLKRFNESLPQRLWRGEELNGQRILLYAEQGFGDTIQMIRLASQVAGRGGRVIALVQRELRELLANVQGVERVVTFDEKFPKCAWRCSLMSLPYVLGLQLDSIPCAVPYIGYQMTAHNLVCERSRPLMVGLSWKGNPANPRDQRRSLPSVKLLQPLVEITGAKFVSLQQGYTLTQTKEYVLLAEKRDTELQKFEDTANRILTLDVVISVDTAVAHLAGALGKRVWILLPTPADWRWLKEREDSPWYPTARLFRQSIPGGWATPISQMRKQLAQLSDRAITDGAY